MPRVVKGNEKEEGRTLRNDTHLGLKFSFVIVKH